MRDADDGMRSASAALRTVTIVAARGGVTVAELARELGVSTSTAHRVLRACLRLDFVRQEHVGGRYLPGQALRELALTSSSAVSLRDIAEPVLARLRRETGETVSLMVFEGRHVRFVQSLEGGAPERVASRLGRVFPAHVISGGKAMLAHEAPGLLERRYPGRHLERPTLRATTDWAQLLDELQIIRRRGWSASVGESDPGVSGVGAAVRLGTGEPVAAVAVSVSSERMPTPAHAGTLAPLVTAAAEAIQRGLRGELAVTPSN